MTTHDAWEKIHSSRDWGAYPTEYVIRFVARNYYQTEREKLEFSILAVAKEHTRGI